MSNGYIKSLDWSKSNTMLSVSWMWTAGNVTTYSRKDWGANVYFITQPCCFMKMTDFQLEKHDDTKCNVGITSHLCILSLVLASMKWVSDICVLVWSAAPSQCNRRPHRVTVRPNVVRIAKDLNCIPKKRLCSSIPIPGAPGAKFALSQCVVSLL